MGKSEVQRFDCARCGHCCEGSGGIVVSNADLARLCVHLDIEERLFESHYGQRRGGKLHIRPGSDGRCVFFLQGTGCGVHEAKPDICRAWPYFRGNLADSESFVMAMDFCPGIDKAQSHEDFVRAGLNYLQQAGLCGTGGSDEAGALQVKDLAARGRGRGTGTGE